MNKIVMWECEYCLTCYTLKRYAEVCESRGRPPKLPDLTIHASHGLDSQFTYSIQSQTYDGHELMVASYVCDSNHFEDELGVRSVTRPFGDYNRWGSIDINNPSFKRMVNWLMKKRNEFPGQQIYVWHEKQVYF